MVAVNTYACRVYLEALHANARMDFIFNLTERVVEVVCILDIMTELLNSVSLIMLSISTVRWHGF